MDRPPHPVTCAACAEAITTLGRPVGYAEAGRTWCKACFGDPLNVASRPMLAAWVRRVRQGYGEGYRGLNLRTAKDVADYLQSIPGDHEVPDVDGAWRAMRRLAAPGERTPRYPGTPQSAAEGIDALDAAEEWCNGKLAGGVETVEATKPKRRRRQSTPKIVPLTAKQTEAVHLVGEHKGNLTEAARAAGVSRQAIKRRYDLANKKLGKAATAKTKTQKLATDSRGQAAASEDRRRAP